MSCNNINNIIPIDDDDDDDDNEIFYSVEIFTCNNDDITLLSDTENFFLKGVTKQTIRERLHYVRFYSILRRSAVVKRVGHFSTIVLVNIRVAQVRVPLVLSVGI